MPKRKFQIDQLILNSPYAEPSTYWAYDRELRMFERKDGRRPAGYVVATPGSKAFDDPGVFVPLPLVNQIRPRVKAWREAEYPGVSGITKRLLEHWQDPDQRQDRRFFFGSSRFSGDCRSSVWSVLSGTQGFTSPYRNRFSRSRGTLRGGSAVGESVLPAPRRLE